MHTSPGRLRSSSTMDFCRTLALWDIVGAAYVGICLLFNSSRWIVLLASFSTIYLSQASSSFLHEISWSRIYLNSVSASSKKSGLTACLGMIWAICDKLLFLRKATFLTGCLKTSIFLIAALSFLLWSGLRFSISFCFFDAENVND